MIRFRFQDALSGLPENRWIWGLLAVATLVPLTFAPRTGRPVPALPAGAVAPADIRAPFAIERVDEEATLSLRRAASDAVPPIYDFDSEASAGARALLADLFDPDRREAALARLPPAVRSGVLSQSPKPVLKQALSRALDIAFERPVASGRSLLPAAGPVVVRRLPGGLESKVEAPLDARSLEEARHAAVRELEKAGLSARSIAAFEPLLRDLVVPSLAANTALADARRHDAASRVEPLLVRVPAGRILVRQGDPVGDEAARTIEALGQARASRLSPVSLLAHTLFVLLLIYFIHRHARAEQRTQRRARDLFALVVAVLVVGLAIDAGGLWLFDRVAASLQTTPYTDPSLYRDLVPWAAGTMLLTLLVGARAGMAYLMFQVPLLGLLTQWDIRSLLFAVLSNLAAVGGMTAYRRRTSLIRAGLLLGGINALLALALGGMSPTAALSTRWPVEMLCAFAGGVLVSMLVSFLLPLLESAFNILTDVRLLELSNLDNPLLRRLAMESPGSYHHSVIVGTLAESAAESIGANALLCRVGAYYHDVGKMVKPAYFVENQRDGENRHDRLAPRLSARVIASHVRQGMELARRHGVPREILDIIPQHHGTRRINYFFQKARRAGAAHGEEVQEADYRYPGPRPQSREAAIVMLADSIEAAARSLDDPQPPRLKGVVNTIVSDVVLDDQFSECDLSFSDLERVRAAFFRTLCSIHHHRIDYPGFDFDAIEERPFRSSPTHDETPVAATPVRSRS